MNRIIELTCVNCVKAKYGNGNFIVALKDKRNRKYEIYLHDKIPVDTNFKINTFHHELIEKPDRVISIRVKQKYATEQPDRLELEIIDKFEIGEGIILTLQDTATHDLFKLKVSGSPADIGTKALFEFKTKGMVIKTTPHFYNEYNIQNWIFFE